MTEQDTSGHQQTSADKKGLRLIRRNAKVVQRRTTRNMKNLTPKPPRRGRPRMPDGEARTLLESFKLSRKESAVIRAAAQKQRKEKSEWMRTVLLSAAMAA